jgi:hypothetical protein
MKILRPLRSRMAAAILALSAGAAWADIPPGPPPRRDPGPSPTVPSTPPKACGVGMGLVVFGLGIVVAWRLPKARPADKPA